MDEAPLTIDVRDKDDIRRKLPRVLELVEGSRVILEEAKAELARAQAAITEAQASFNHWANLYTSLHAMAPDPESAVGAVGVSGTEQDVATTSQAQSASSGASATARPRGSVEVVAAVLNDAGREMTTRDVRSAAADHGLADDTVSWALWKASSLGLIRRVKKGRYAPLDASTGQSELSVSSNGSAAETDRAEETPGVHSR